MEPLSIHSSRGTYKVNFVDGLRDLVSRLPSSNALIALDGSVAKAYREDFQQLLSRVPSVIFATDEENKTLQGCEQILEALVANNANRETRLIAIGGGIVQDVATLCAHLYFRGIEWTFVPTTMLAMTDSCIGAKASINFKGFKNQLGVFHSPSEVYVCTAFLGTLPDEQIRSGYGEAFKLHFAESPNRFFSLADRIESEGWRTGSAAEVIRSSLAIKKRYIEADEFDLGIRRHLNYGHTFGHALESITDHAIPHGLAICWGMDLINFISLRAGRIPNELFATVHAKLLNLFSWRLDRPISVPLLLAATRRDKKATGGRLSLVVPGSAGALEIVQQEYGEAFTQTIESYLSSFSIVAS